MKRISIASLSIAVATFIIGCDAGSKITKENYAKIKEGMTKAEVIAILGEPTGTELRGVINDIEIKGPVWQGSGFKIVTTFPEGKLSFKRIDRERRRRPTIRSSEHASVSRPVLPITSIFPPTGTGRAAPACR